MIVQGWGEETLTCRWTVRARFCDGRTASARFFLLEPLARTNKLLTWSQSPRAWPSAARAGTLHELAA